MADCVLCGGHNNFNYTHTANPVESFKLNMGGYWDPHEKSKQRCCAVVCEDCCNRFADGAACGQSQCYLCRQRLNLWVVVNVLGTEEVISNSN